MTDTTHDRLAEIQARCDAATEGPWEWAAHTTVDGDKWAVFQGESTSALAMNNDGWVPDAEFIAHARTDVPALLSAVEAVMKRHRPVEVEPSETICAECSTLRGQGETARYFPFTEYPCPTVTRIQEALNGIA